MSSQNFVFPPPPPPPPQAGPQNYPPYSQPSYQQSHGPQGSGNGGYRGRGRGVGFKGSRGASNYGGQPPRNNGYSGNVNNQVAPTSGYTVGSYPLPNYPPVQQPQYPSQGHNGNRYGPSSDYGNGPANNHYNASNQFFRPAPSNGRPPVQQPYQPANTTPIVMGPPIRMGFDHERSNHYSLGPQPQLYPQAAGLKTGSYPIPEQRINLPHQLQNPSTDPRYARHSPPNSFPGNRGRGHKRVHSDAFGPKHRTPMRTPAPPAVPSFGNPLPVKPPVPQENSKRPRKKKRKHNQLGLTPKAEEHESSEEEEDVDEEAKLAASQSGAIGEAAQGLQFSYKGQPSTLKTASDIAAWIQERKKRFPTKARAAEATERKKKMQEEERAARQHRKEDTRKKKELADQKRKEIDKESKAKLKAEKLRKQYEKAQKRVAELEAKKSGHEGNPLLKQEGALPSQECLSGSERTDMVESRLSREDELQVQSQDRILVNGETGADIGVQHLANETQHGQNDFSPSEPPEIRGIESLNKSNTEESPSHGPDPLTPTSQPLSPHASSQPSTSPVHQASAPPGRAFSATSQQPVIIPPDMLGEPQEGANLKSSDLDRDTDGSDSYTSSDLSSSEDENDNSSSGTSSSSGAPNSEPFQRTTEPERVSAPKPAKKRAICKDFLRNGRCKKGDQCHFRHELPKRGSGAKAGRKQVEKRAEAEEKKGRMSLYQRMVAQEREKEDQIVLQHIIFLGEQGALDEPEVGLETTTVHDDDKQGLSV